MFAWKWLPQNIFSQIRQTILSKINFMNGIRTDTRVTKLEKGKINCAQQSSTELFANLKASIIR
jgi:hypothetical protein